LLGSFAEPLEEKGERECNKDVRASPQYESFPFDDGLQVSE